MTQPSPTLGEITYSRVWDAPRELVFECMTTPEHLAHFWGPIGVTTPIENITVELRPGGAFTTIMVNDADGTEHAMHAVFVEVVKNEKLSWTEADVEGGMTTSVTFKDHGPGTCETIAHQTNVPEMFQSPEAQAGMQSSFDRMAAYLATL